MGENATRVSIEGITELNSPCWNNFFVGSKDISFDNVYIHAFSTNVSVRYLERLRLGQVTIRADSPLTGPAEEY